MNILTDIERLLAPLPGLSPCGRDLRYTGVYDRIKEARRSDEALAQGEWQTDIKISDWKAVIDLCCQALRRQSKDLQIAVWLTEALLHHHGYGGLAEGLHLTSSLIERYWDQLFPPVIDGDMGYRTGPLLFLDEKLPLSLFQVAICDPRNTKGFSYFQWQESSIVGFDKNLDEKRKKQRTRMIEDGKISGEAFGAAVNLSSIGFYKKLMQQLAQCRRNLDLLNDVVNSRFAPDPPGFTKLASAVDECYHLVKKIFGEKQKSEVVPEEDTIGILEVTPLGNGAAETGCHAVPRGRRDLQPAGGKAICDISDTEHGIWAQAVYKLNNGNLKGALDQLLEAASLAPSVRARHRYQLLLAKLCLQANRPDLARPIAEKLYAMIDTLNLEQWEHPVWIAEVIETLYRCLSSDNEKQSDQTRQLFEKLCTLNITRAAAYRIG